MIRILAEGCEHCEPMVVFNMEPEGEHHFLASLDPWFTVTHDDGQVWPNIIEAWAGTPGKLLTYGPNLHQCPCRPGICGRLADGPLVPLGGEAETQGWWTQGWWRQLIEVDEVRAMRKVPLARKVATGLGL